MKKLKTTITLLSLIALSFNSCGDYPTIEEMQRFEIEMVKALHLKLIVKGEYYELSRLNIFNDTLVGYHSGGIYGDEYFVQSLKKTTFKVEFNNQQLIYPMISNIDQYRNGCLYFGEFGRSTVQSLCTDGTLTQYFKKYDTVLFYANKIMLYKQLAVVTSMNGVYVFNLNSQCMLWHYTFIDAPYDGLSAIIGDKLVFTETISKPARVYTNIVCYNLDKMDTVWLKTLNNSNTFIYDHTYQPHSQLLSNAGRVFIPQGGHLYTFNLADGQIVSIFPWHGFFEKSDRDPLFNVEENRLYLSSRKDLLCIDMSSNKPIWKINNVSYMGIYKTHVIGQSNDFKFYLVINKFTGKIEAKIGKPKSRTVEYFNFIDRYIIINRNAIYE